MGSGHFIDWCSDFAIAPDAARIGDGDGKGKLCCHGERKGRQRRFRVDNLLSHNGIGMQTMQMKLKTLIAAMLAAATLSACAPLIVGTGAAVVADEVAENENGGDGLF